tara:strand:- start:323 stop:1060 length:738 start_codon:yes stop_codon:yes gene_type:complete
VSLAPHNFLRYNSHILIPEISENGQEMIRKSRVLVIGLGGLGCPVSTYLAASGVGCLGLCDFDCVERSNIQRQLLFSERDIGIPKVQVAREKVMNLNPDVLVESYEMKFNELVDELNYDIFIDCTDNMETKLLLNDYCYKSKKYFISAAASRLEGQLIGFDFKKHRKCCLRCIFDHDSSHQFNCADVGILIPVLGVMGCLQVTMAINMILDKFAKHAVLSRFDSIRNEWIELKGNTLNHCQVCGF